MAKDVKKEMTLEQALKILRGDIFNCPSAQLEEALRVVREKDPTNPLLSETTKLMESFKQENNLQENNPEVYAKNFQDLDDISEKYSFQNFLKAKSNSDIASYVKQTELYADHKAGQQITDAKVKTNYLSLLFEGAKLKAQTSLAGDPKFEKLKPASKAKAFRAQVKTIFFADFAQTAIASSMEKPTTSEQKIGSEAYRNYVVRQSKKAAEIFNGLVSGGKKIRIKTDSILTACADTAVRVENYIGVLRQKAQNSVTNAAAKTKNAVQDGVASARERFNLLADSLQQKKNKFEALANQVSENRYEIWKNIKGSFSDNKFKLIGNVAANAAFGYWTAAAAAGTVAAGAAAPVMVPALAAYAAYHAAGAWVFPVVAEMRKINRKRREAGEEPLKFTAQLKQAWQNKMSKPKDKRSYLIGGILNTGLAVAGFAWLKDGVEAADNAKMLVEGAQEGLNVTLAANIAETKHAISVSRAAVPTVAQLVNAGISYAASVNDPDNKEKAAEFKQDATAALIGAGFNVLFQGMGFAHGEHAESAITPDTELLKDAEAVSVVDSSAVHSQDSTGGVKGFFGRIFGHKEKVDSLHAVNNVNLTTAPADSNVVAASGNAVDSIAADLPVKAGDANLVEDAGGLQGVQMNGIFPSSFTSQEEMGISEKQFNILVQTTEGTLKAATGDEVTLDRAYVNLENAMENFPDKTKEEVLYKFNRLYAFMRKAYDVGDGTLRETPSGSEYLQSRFESMNIAGMDDGKMASLVSFAKENSYAGKADLQEGLNELFPEGLDKKTMGTLVATIQSNQRFYQHSEEMEALINLLGCGKELSAEQAFKLNALLDKTDELLSTGRENTVLTGLNLNTADCNNDEGEWRRLVTPRVPEEKVEVVKVEPIVPEEKEEVVIPLPEIPVPGDVEVPEEETVIIDDELQMREDIIAVAPMAAPRQVPVEEEVLQPQPKVRKVVVTGMSQLQGENEADKEKWLDDDRASKMLKRASSHEDRHVARAGKRVAEPLKEEQNVQQVEKVVATSNSQFTGAEDAHKREAVNSRKAARMLKRRGNSY